ncbi:hypothetical protein D3C87_234990 [compost metagenome]
MIQEFYRIYKSELRGLIEGNQRKSFITFNEGNYQDESREPIGILSQFTEHYLSGNRQLELTQHSDSFILIPIEGELQVSSNGSSRNIAPQEIFTLSSEGVIRVGNFSPSEISRFYGIHLDIPNSEQLVHSFDFSFRNELITLVESAEISLKMGVFDGRKESKLILPANVQGFVSVIHGAFEVQNRLLETNDCLFMRNNQVIEFESLSENAIILIFSF